MNTVLIILAIGAVAAVLFLVLRKKSTGGVGGGTGGRAPEVMNGVGISRKLVQVTPKGVTVYSENGIVPSSLGLIDDALTEVFADAIADGYTKALQHSFYDVFIPFFPCAPSPEAGVYSFRVDAPNYDQSPFDQDPRPGHSWVYAPEMVVSLGTPGSTIERGQMIVCPQEQGLRLAVRFGAEHVILAGNDTDRFMASETHAGVFGHPLLPWGGRDQL